MAARLSNRSRLMESHFSELMAADNESLVVSLVCIVYGDSYTLKNLLEASQYCLCIDIG